MGRTGRGKGALKRLGGGASVNAPQTKETGVVGFMVELVPDHGPKKAESSFHRPTCATANIPRTSLRSSARMRLRAG